MQKHCECGAIAFKSPCEIQWQAPTLPQRPGAEAIRIRLKFPDTLIEHKFTWDVTVLAGISMHASESELARTSVGNPLGLQIRFAKVFFRARTPGLSLMAK